MNPLARATELLGKITQGKKAFVKTNTPSINRIEGYSVTIIVVMSATDLDFNDYTQRQHDSEFIAESPELMAALVKRVEELETRERHWKEIIDEQSRRLRGMNE